MVTVTCHSCVADLRRLSGDKHLWRKHRCILAQVTDAVQVLNEAIFNFHGMFIGGGQVESDEEDWGEGVPCLQHPQLLHHLMKAGEGRRGGGGKKRRKEFYIG